MLSNLLVKLSPSPPSSRKRQMEAYEQQTSSGMNTIFQQESSTNEFNKRIRPVQSQSLTRHEDYHHVRQQPRTLEIFVPGGQERERVYTRNYEIERKRSSSENLRMTQQRPTPQQRNDFEIEREYLRCLDDLTNEYEKLQQQNKPKQKTTYETTESFESVEQIVRRQPQIQTESTYHRSTSEGGIHRQLKPLSTYNVTRSDEDINRSEFSLHQKQRSQPIRIHSSSSSIPGETSIKYIRTERRPVEVVVPKPQIYTTQGEHSSTVVKDIRRQSRKITTNVHQDARRRTIEGQHDLRIIEQPITAEQTRPVQFTVPKPIPTEHSSTFVVKSKKGGRFHTLDISNSLERQRTLSGEHELRVIPEPIRSNRSQPVELLFPKPTFSTSTTTSSSHSATVVKQNRTPKSSVLFDNIQTRLKGEHDLRLIDRPIQPGPSDGVELIVPKSVTDTVDHTTTIVTETQPHRRVLEITGSGRQMASEHERKYYQEKVRVEEEIEVKVPKPKHQQVEHSSTIVKHSHGRGPIFEIDTSQQVIQGEHETKFYEDSIETQVDAMQLLVAKPKLPVEHSTTIVKGQRGPTQRVAIDYTRPIPGEHQTKHHHQPIESYSEMEFIVPKQQTTVLSDNYQSTSEYDERYVSSTYEYEEDKSLGEHTTTYLKQTRPKYEPVELVVDRPRQLPSVSKLITDIPSETQVTSIKPSRLHLIEDSSVKLDFSLNENNLQEQYDEMEIVLEKPLVRDSSSTVLANIQSGLELKSFHPTTTPRQTIEESSSTFTYQREQQTNDDILELRLRKPHIQDSTTTIVADVQSELNVQGPLKPTPYIQQTIDESTSTLTMDLNKPQQTKPFELIIPRIDQETSTNTILAQVEPTLAGLRAKLDVPSIEQSTSTFLLEQKKRFDEEVEIVMPKPKRFETSSTTMHADVDARLETKDIRPTQIQPEPSTSAFYFEETTNYVIPDAVELRMKQPTIGDSSTTLLANVKPTIDTQYVQRLGQIDQSLERSSSEIIYETRREQIQPSEVELILPRPRIQESTSVMLADIHSTLPPLQFPVKSSSDFIFEKDTLEKTPVDLRFQQQPSSHRLLSNLDETYVLGSTYQQDQTYGSPVIHADLNKPLELVFDVDGGNTSSVSQQYRRDYRTLTNTTGGIDTNSTLLTELQPVEFLVSGNNLGGYSSTTTEQYSTSPSGYSTRTTKTTTTKRKITSVDTGNETTRSITRGIRPYDQVEFILQPDSTISTTSYSEHSPEFTVTLHDQNVRESDSVLFEVTVSAQPSAEIIWDKDGQPIGADSPFRIDYYGDGRTTLYIPEVFFDDQGYYTCTATNTLGTCRTTAYLTVNTTGDSFSPKRRQLTSSTTYTYQQGPTEYIESYRITSQPTTVSQITEETEVYRIPSQYQQNEITYSVHGTQQKFQPVQFLVTTDQEQTQPSYRDETITTSRYTQQSQITSELNFTKPLEPINAREGGTIQITVHLSTFGSYETRPKIEWYHHGQLIVPDNQHYRITEDHDTATLEIINVTKFDTGQVWCTATTSSGTATTTCSITVEERPVRRTHRKTTTTTTSSSSQYQIVPEDTTYTSQTSHTQYGLYQPKQPDRHVISEYYTTSQQTYPQTYTTQETDYTTQTQFSLHKPKQPDQHVISEYYTTAQQTHPQTRTVQETDYTTQTQFSLHKPKQPDQHVISEYYTTSQQTYPQTRTIQETDYTTQTQFSLHKPKQPDQHIITEYYTDQQEVSPQTYGVKARPHYEDYNAEAHFTLNQPKQPEYQTTSNYYATQDTDYTTQAQFPLQKLKPQVTTTTEEQPAPLAYNFQVKAQPKDYASEDVYGEFSLHQPKQPDQEVSATFTAKPSQPGPHAFASITAEHQLSPKQPQTSQDQFVPASNIPQAPPLLPSFNVRPTYSDSQVKILNNGLQDQPLYPGSETVFECQFSGKPEKVQWFRNDVEIFNTPQQVNNRIYHITNPNTGTTRLIIKPTLEEDAGVYSVKVTGPTGEEVTTSKLIPALQFQNLQKKKIEQTQRKALVQELEEKQAKRMRPSQKVAPRGSFTSYATSDDDVFFDATQRNTAPTSHRQPTAPTVARPLKDLDVKEGQPIQLTCQVQGFPKSELLWFKNNVPLPLSARHKTAYDAGSGTITLRINDARPEDSGVYTLVAQNPQGHVQVSAQVDVRETPGIDETSYVQPDAFKYIEKQPIAPRPGKPTRRESDTTNLQQKPAKILKTPMSTSVVEGSTATFTCQVEGSPKPKVAWLKDNKPLMSGARFSTYFDQASKTAVLRISDISKDDQGYYTCVVDNPFNSDRSTATLQVIPETKVDQRSYVETDAFRYLAPEKQPRTATKDTDRTSGVDSESFVNPESFRYLEGKKPLKTVEDNMTIDDRPIVDLEAFRYLEARQTPKNKRDEGVRASIDDTPIIAPDAFRYLERKAEVANLKKQQDTGPSIDETPQVDLTAFQYLERKNLPKKPEEGPSIDETSIVNPEAFKYLERKPTKKVEDTGPAIDESPMVNPEAFRYLEKQVAPKPRDQGPTIDTTPLVNPEVFKYLEKTVVPQRVEEGPTVDTRPIVPQEAFRWIERPKEIERRPEGPAIDESSYVNPQAFKYLEAKPKSKVVDEGPSIDETFYVNPQAFKYLEAAPTKKPVDQGPSIDTSNYVNPDLFAQFEIKPKTQPIYEEYEVQRAPKLIQPLKNTQAFEGKPVALVAIVDGFPVPHLTWLKDGVEIPASARVTTNYDIPSKTAWIQINDVRPDDNAVYTLFAHNPTGDTRTDARLLVVPNEGRPIDETAFVPAEAFANIERNATLKRPTQPETTGVDDTSFVNPNLFAQFEVPLKQPRQDFSEEVVVQVPAKFLAPLKSIQAPESVTVALEAIVEGSPIPTFTWLKDNLPLNESTRYITNYDIPSKRVTLTIRDLRENDSGIYTLLASNGPQLQHSSATIQVVGAPNIDQSSFIPLNAFQQLERPFNQPSQTSVQPGVDQTSYVSQPDRFAVFDQIQPNRRPLNEFSGVDETPLVSMEKIRLLEIPSHVPQQPNEVEETQAAPVVLAPLQPIDAQEGTPVVLAAKIAGTPMPNFSWFKDDTPLVAGTRYTTYYDIPSKLVVLQINDARPNDTGNYTVRADNPSGTVETTATLNITPAKSGPDSFIPTEKFRPFEEGKQPQSTEYIGGVDERPLVDLTKLQHLEIKPNQTVPEEETGEQLKPTVLIPLRNVQAVETQPVVLSAQIEGKPQPLFTWFKNNEPLPEGNRFRTHYDIPSKTIFLTIAGAREDDTGTYRVVAKNPSGEEDTTAEVTIELNQPKIDQRSFVPQTAFDKLEKKPFLTPLQVTSGVDQSSFFNQELFRPFDERNIKHTSALVGGEDSDAAMPISAPKVLQPLRPTTTTEGETVVLIAQVDGYPLPQFTWIHNNKPIMASNRITPHYDMLTKRCFLQILATRPSDTGTYELLAENPAGQDRTKTEITIVPVSKIDQTGYVPYDKFSTLEFKPRIPSDLHSGVDATPFVSGEIFRLLETKPVNQQFVPESEQDLPIEILVPLKPAVAQEGQPVILTTKIRGRPMPQFTWLRNNQPILESTRFQTHYDFPSETLVLEISDIWPHDEGTYTVIAENPKTGQRLLTSAPLTVRTDSTLVDQTAFVAPDAFRTLESSPNQRSPKIQPGVDTGSFVSPNALRALEHVQPKPVETEEKEQPRTPPKVLVPLQPVKIHEGQPINFTAKIDGFPVPSFVWFKNGQPLQESNRIWSHYDIPSKTVLLQISGARPDDTGKYDLLAQNPLGRDQTQTTVTISSSPTIDTNAFVSPEKFAAFDVPYGRNIPEQSGVDTTPFVQPERFTQLEVKAPAPTKEDMEQMEAPKVLKPLENEQVNEGTPVLLQATIVGKPTPKFVWLKDNQPLNASNRLRTRYDIGTKQVMLQINDVRPLDAGQYTVIASNPVGEEKTIAQLTVQPDQPGVDERGFVPKDKFQNLERPQGHPKRPLEIIPGIDALPEKLRKLNQVPLSEKPQEEEVPEVQRPPKVLQPLSTVDVDELSPVFLTTNVDAGAPMATFTWYKDNQPLSEGNRYTTKYDIPTKTLTLQILNSRPEDTGNYTVRATNPSGSDETSTSLNVKPIPSIDTRPFIQPEHLAPLEVKAPTPKKEELQQPQPPKVVVPLDNEETEEGAPVLLKATITGKPTPNFVWLKDGQPLLASNRLRTQYDVPTNQVLLQINDVRPQDAGQYEVIATNPAGKETTRSTLTVIPEETSPEEEEEKRPMKIVPGVDVQPTKEAPGAKRAPKVVVPLKDTTVEELMPVIFSTTIDAGAPMATFTWLKNGQPLNEGPRYTTTYDVPSKVLTMEIVTPRPDDQGTYTLQAVNPSGKVETTAKLTIQPPKQPKDDKPLEVKAPQPTKEDLTQQQPPKVVVPLKEEQVEENSPVLLKATITGKPTPDFTWFKDNKPLTPSNRLRSRYDAPTQQILLQIDNVRPEDAGQYTVLAKNPVGQDQTGAKLTIAPQKPTEEDQKPLNIVPGVDVQPPKEAPGAKRAPKVVVPLKDTVIEEQMPVILSSTIDAGAPMATFTWLKNGQPLKEAPRYTTTYDVPSKVLTLEILDTRPEDQGTYTAQATNPSGKVDTTSKLTIQPSKQPKENKPLEAKAPQPTKEDLTQQQPPKVIVPLENETVKEGKPALLKATITGKPTPDFTWFKDNKPLQPTPRLRTRYNPDTNQVLLQIDNVRPEDAGQYTVVAKNPAGQDQTSGNVTVAPEKPTEENKKPLNIVPGVDIQPPAETPGAKRPPKVLVPLKDTVIEEEMPIILSSTIDAGSPMSTFNWTKNGQPLTEGTRYTTTYDIPSKVLTLEILDSRPSDAGTYTLQATNPLGKADTTAKLTIQPSKQPKEEKPLEVKAPPPAPQDLQQMQPPKVVVPIENQEVPEKSPVLLKATITGKPTPDFTWFKDNKPLQPSPRLRTRYNPETNEVLLQIDNVQPQDVGQYTVVAKNPAGQDQTSGKLTVAPKKPTEDEKRPVDIVPGIDVQPPKEAPGTKRPPRIIVPLKDGTIEEKMPAILSSTVDAGSPMATLTWFKNDTPLEATPRYRTTYDVPTKVVTLEILDTRPEDQGTYKLQAVNPSGKADTTAKLTVQPKEVKPLEVKAPPPSPQDLQEMQPPKVIVPIENQEVPENTPVLLKATIIGKPTPDFAWFKDNQPLQPSLRFRTRYSPETNQVFLQIDNVRPQDVGNYTVEATNPAGKDSTTGKLTVKPKQPGDQPPAEDKKRPLNVVPGVDIPAAPEKPEEQRPPRVLVPLIDTVVEEEMPIVLKTTIDAGSPTATFTWHKNDQPLNEGTRYTTKYDIPSKVLTLQILHARPDDQGTYTVKAVNPLGSDETTAELTIKPEEITPVEVKAPPPTPTDLQKMEPPKVIVPLEEKTVKEGLPVLLKATITGKPTPDFTWLKDTKPLRVSPRLTPRYNPDTQQVLLQIDSVEPEDIGKYTVVAKNPAGQDQTTGSLNVAPDDTRPVEIVPGVDVPITPQKPGEQRPPRILVPLKDGTIDESMPVILTTTVDAGSPMATFTWLKNGKPLKKTPRYITKYDVPSKVLTLQILATKPDDQGTYTLKAVNPVGSDETSGNLTVKPEDITPVQVKAPPPAPADLQKMEPPKVIVPLENKTVKEDAPTLLKATITGRPTPDFVWFKDNKPLQPSPRFRTRYNPDTKQVLLQIDNVQPEDLGPYTVVATNPAGKDQTTGSLKVAPADDKGDVPEGKRPLKVVPGVDVPLAPEKPGEQRPPKVIVPLKDGTVEEEMPIILSTTIDGGSPMATFTWLKNDQPLSEGTRYTTKYDIPSRVLTLQILHARPDDQGKYTVHAVNPVGQDQTSATLTIKPEDITPVQVKAPPPAPADLQRMEPPIVIVPLENKKVKRGTPVLLKATITGRPTPDFAWFKDNQPLQPSNKIRTRYNPDTKQVLLQIDNVQPEDVGEYLVVATNPAGQDQTVGALGLLPGPPGDEGKGKIPRGQAPKQKEPEDQGKRPIKLVPGVDMPNAPEKPGQQRPPRVIVHLTDYIIEELMPIILTTKIDAGSPMATFTWYKDGQPLSEGTRYTTKYDIPNQILTLQIIGGRPADQGTYTARAVNPVGSDETSCKLTIQPVPSIDEGAPAQPFEPTAPLSVKAPPPAPADLQRMEPPIVIVPLENKKVKRGTPVLLKATITGRPTPDFAWYKDNQPLQPSNKIRTRYNPDTKQVLLQIDNVQPEDVGEYLVVATNPAGQDQTAGALGLLPGPPGDEGKGKVPSGKSPRKQPEGTRKRPLTLRPPNPGELPTTPDKLRKLNPIPPTTKPDQPEVPEVKRPPRVIVPLADCVIEELMPVVLTSTIDAGVPMATFTWLKDGQPLLEGNRYKTKYDIPTRIITLQILNSRPEDTGNYTVRAVNPVGSDETSCNLTIQPVAGVDTRSFIGPEHFRPLENRPDSLGNLDNERQPLRPPKVLVPMNNVNLTEFQPIVLKSIIDAGYPMGKFTWRKDGQPLPESNRYKINYDINTRTATLYIDSARPTTDTGRYTVHVENPVGKDETTGQVNVEATPAIDERPFVPPSKFGKFETPILKPQDSVPGRENLAPWIRLIKELVDQDIDESKPAQLICNVDAHPAATINWFKDGKPLTVSQRFIPEYEPKSGVVRLTIYPVHPADSGTYKMVARNVAGEVSTKCTLRIAPTANIEETPLVKFTGLRKTPQHPPALGSEPVLKPVDADDGQKPYFIKVPPDQEVPEGQLVRLDYIPAGRPEPTLQWFRNGVPLKPNDGEHVDVINEGGVHSLLVRNPKLGPTVEYTCVAKNKYGEAPFTVHLTVVPRGANIPPYFIEQLYNIIIIEGQDTKLDACAQGFPEPTVAWEKDGQPLVPNREYKVEFEGPKTTLYIRTAKLTDAGWFQCTATSPAGTCVTKCKVTVIPLSEASQLPKDTPQFGPQQLSKVPGLPEEDIRSKYMTIPVKPPEIKPEELYKLPKRPKKGENPLDEVKRRGLKVLPDEVLSAVPGSLEEFPEEEMYSKDRPQPPKFKVHLKSHLNLNEDDPCMFEAKLIPVRDPMMRVQWFKNGKVLHHASRMIPRYDFADVSLQFLWTFAEDDGIYECVATNPYGEDRTRAELKCRPKRSIIYNTQLPEGMEGVSKLQMLEDEIKYTASMIGLEEKVQEKEPKIPEFIMPLEDISVDEGDNAKFIAKVDGHPRPRVTWSINGTDVFNGSRYKLVYDGLVHSLDIPHTRQYDAGTVRCTAKNALGQVESVATLNLRLRQDYRSVLSKTPGGVETGIDDSFDVDIEERLRLRAQLRQRESIDDQARRPSVDRSLHPLHSKLTDRMSWRQTVEKQGDAPNFTKQLLPLKVKEGSKVSVSVEFTGDPAPTVSWYRDGFMVEDSEDFKIITTPTTSTLTIKHAFIIDSGLYTVKLFNPIGIRQCQAAIRISPIIAEDQTPRFLDAPHDTEILSGDPVRFQCRVEGEPFPTVAFYREDEPVNLNDKRFRAIQEGDVFTLLLFEALPADSGQYEAVAENSVGKANTRFTLTVVPRGPGAKKASIVDDPKLIHKVPYLEKPLEDLRVKEGESATFECIIPASFGSDVKWYKGTSEWQIKPSKFFKPKSDGTKHQLFILEAYAEDEGLYKCVVSNPVGTTATTATLKVDHSMQVPEFVVGFSNLTTYEGEQVRFEVEVRGDPAPTVSWYRDGELIRDSPDFQIFTEANRSLLYISEVFMEDQGLFTCTASNAAGSSECSARLTIEPRPQL